MKYANKWSENAETAQQMEKNSSISLAFSFLTVLVQALLQQCRSESKRCIQIPGLEKNTKIQDRVERKLPRFMCVSPTLVGCPPNKQKQSTPLRPKHPTYTNINKNKQTLTHTHTCIRTNIPRERGGGKKMVLNDESEDDEK